MILNNRKESKVIMYILVAVVVLVVVFFVLKKGSGEPGTGAGYENVTAEDVHSFVGDSSYQLVDVREPSEFSSGHVKGAVNIPVASILDNLDKLNKDKKIVFICRSGNRSSRAAKMVAKQEGYSLYNMKGGMNAWSYEVEK